MNKLIVAAVATAVSGFVSVPAQAGPTTSGPSSVTVVNTAAAPVPTTVQNTVGVDVLTAPATQARTWSSTCTINVGATNCSINYALYAPAGMVMRVVGVSGVINGGCQTEYGGSAVLTGAFELAGHGATRRLFVTGPVLRRPNNTVTVLEFSGNAFFTMIDSVNLGLAGPAATCQSPGEIAVNYVLEPLA